MSKWVMASVGFVLFVGGVGYGIYYIGTGDPLVGLLMTLVGCAMLALTAETMNPRDVDRTRLSVILSEDDQT